MIPADFRALDEPLWADEPGPVAVPIEAGRAAVRRRRTGALVALATMLAVGGAAVFRAAQRTFTRVARAGDDAIALSRREHPVGPANINYS